MCHYVSTFEKVQIDCEREDVDSSMQNCMTNQHIERSMIDLG